MKPGQHGPVDPFDADRFDAHDPDPWLALALDQSVPIDDGAKRALLMGSRSWSRRWLFPVARPLIFAFFVLVMGALVGIIGAILAVPIAAILKILYEEFYYKPRHPDEDAISHDADEVIAA